MEGGIQITSVNSKIIPRLFGTSKAGVSSRCRVVVVLSTSSVGRSSSCQILFTSKFTFQFLGPDSDCTIHSPFGYQIDWESLFEITKAEYRSKRCSVRGRAFWAGFSEMIPSFYTTVAIEDRGLI